MKSLCCFDLFRTVAFFCIASFPLVAKANWVTVSKATQQAQPNCGYILTSNSAATTVTLPGNAHIGDTVRLSCVGLGGWTVSTSKGQFICAAYSALMNPGFLSGSSGVISAIASSSDGSKLVAIADQIYTSENFGASWTARGQGGTAVASSADGSKLVACGNTVLTSSNYGVTWVSQTVMTDGGVIPQSPLYTCITSSTDGAKVEIGGSGEQIVSLLFPGFAHGPASGPAGNWTSVASSANGTMLVATMGGGQIYTWTAFSKTWTTHDSARNWTSVASSADGSKLAATVGGGQIYTSIDAGTTWTPRASAGNWTSIASSADGTKLAAAGESIYTSADSGVTWTSLGISGELVASSSDGSRLLVANGDQVCPVEISNSVGASGLPFGMLSGPQFSAVELQFTGNGQWQLLSHEGIITSSRSLQ